MIAAVEQRGFDIDHRITRQRAIVRRFFDSLLNGADIFARNRTALDRIDELKPSAGLLAVLA